MTPKLLLAVSILALPLAAQAGSLHLYTENTPPDIMRDGERITGISTDKVKEIMARAGVSYTMEITAWKRAYELALRMPDACVFSTSRTPEREALFKWVGPLREFDWTLYGLANAPFQLTALDDAKKLRIGGYSGDVRVQYLLDRGFKVDAAPDNFSNPRKLMGGRIDLWVTSHQLANGLLEQEGLAGKIVPLLTFHSSRAYLACNKAVPDATIAAMSAAMADIVKDGTSAAIDRKYANWRPR
ncbi:transporter substrate-binding domain-containing protein [Pseudoduganella eburnea]|uniref:Transporter substrate-binding domain-containing protein n=1 Tax=Massilia eburnea TaxID=1776165 RepID=A0A6L6QDM0_9BURK|nr:ABC transporter substrate-binding protein [Massilia eburnea]MTW10295.1 transporter substrate-binding domain-containing protein [Massilia eburnea]